MSNIKNILNTLPDVAKYILVAGVIGFISWLYPSKATFKYEYHKGSTWNYEDLVAPYDFALIKTEDIIEAEKRAIQDEFTPYYSTDLSVKEVAIQSFLTDLGEASFLDSMENPGWTTKQIKNIERLGVQFLENIYDQGVVQAEVSHIDRPNDFLVNVITNRKAEPKLLNNLMTSDRAKTKLRSEIERYNLPTSAFNFVAKYVRANINIDRALSEKEMAIRLEGIAPTKGLFKRGDLIIGKGSLITDDTYNRLISYQDKYQKDIIGSKSRWGVLAGYVLLTSLLIGMFLYFLFIFYPKVYAGFSGILFLLMWLVIYAYLVYIADHTPNISAYLVPFAIAPIVIKNFYNTSIAIFATLIIALISSFISSLGYEFTFIILLVGLIAILGNKETRSWAQFFRTILLILAAYIISHLGLELIKEGNLEQINWKLNSWFFGSAFLTLLAYPLIPLLERIFGYTSSITLAELSDFNKPLLKELSLNARGTFQHSLQVSNLSEAAADAIGANSLLVKVAAMYHDIGKLDEPEYFIENQSGKNPHDLLPPFESAEKILGHVTKGVAKAKKHRLPTVIIDFIKSHHGDTRVEYFYRKQLELKPDGNFDEGLFRYSGPKPVSKEETILLIADTIEAASKSLKEPNQESISQLVDKLIESKVNSGQLSNSLLTYQELEKCRDSFKQTLQSIYHVRIAYPGGKKE